MWTVPRKKKRRTLLQSPSVQVLLRYRPSGTNIAINIGKASRRRTQVRVDLRSTHARPAEQEERRNISMAGSIETNGKQVVSITERKGQKTWETMDTKV
ncbi:hypothetical protein SAMD00023353_2301230 [Rosellinia necatrix]|uniref:Uncharacterized protein n=1 Tax=Rosellinia necatrix TaxID=77044 RepID=A0A1S8A888_ROSNE|nr:hypothetical protein SAMD00023353_2301230 [Rosellinia necatrix]